MAIVHHFRCLQCFHQVLVVRFMDAQALVESGTMPWSWSLVLWWPLHSTKAWPALGHYWLPAGPWGTIPFSQLILLCTPATHLCSLTTCIEQCPHTCNLRGTNLLLSQNPLVSQGSLFWEDKPLDFITLILDLRSVSHDCTWPCKCAPLSATRWSLSQPSLVFSGPVYYYRHGCLRLS